MATETLTHPLPELTGSAGGIGERAEIARRAGVAVQEITVALMKFDANDFEGAAAEALLHRLFTLAGVVMSAVDDDDSIENLCARLEGRRNDAVHLDVEGRNHG